MAEPLTVTVATDDLRQAMQQLALTKGAKTDTISLVLLVGHTLLSTPLSISANLPDAEAHASMFSKPVTAVVLTYSDETMTRQTIAMCTAVTVTGDAPEMSEWRLPAHHVLKALDVCAKSQAIRLIPESDKMFFQDIDEEAGITVNMQDGADRAVSMFRDLTDSGTRLNLAFNAADLPWLKVDKGEEPCVTIGIVGFRRGGKTAPVSDERVVMQTSLVLKSFPVTKAAAPLPAAADDQETPIHRKKRVRRTSEDDEEEQERDENEEQEENEEGEEERDEENEEGDEEEEKEEDNEDEEDERRTAIAQAARQAAERPAPLPHKLMWCKQAMTAKDAPALIRTDTGIVLFGQCNAKTDVSERLYGEMSTMCSSSTKATVYFWPIDPAGNLNALFVVSQPRNTVCAWAVFMPMTTD